MGRKKQTDIFPHVSYICVGDEAPVRWDSLSKEKESGVLKKMMDKVSENVSRHINAHPEELEPLL